MGYITLLSKNVLHSLSKHIHIAKIATASTLCLYQTIPPSSVEHIVLVFEFRAIVTGISILVPV